MSRRALGSLLAAAALLVAGAGCTDDSSGSAAEMCAVLGDGRAFTALFEQGFDPTDTQRALTQLQAARVDLEQLREAAPKEQRADIDAEADYLDAVLRVLDTIGPDDPAAVVAGINALDAERSAAQVASLELRTFEESSCRGGSSSTAP